MTRYSVSPRGSDRSMVGLNRPFADQFRTTSFMHCSSSTAGTSVRLTRSWAGCPDRVVVSGLSPDGEVFLLTSPFIDRYVGQVPYLVLIQIRRVIRNSGHHDRALRCARIGSERLTAQGFVSRTSTSAWPRAIADRGLAQPGRPAARH